MSVGIGDKHSQKGRKISIMPVEFEWSDRPSFLKQFVDRFGTRLPQIITITDGYAGRDDLHLIGAGEMYYVHKLAHQPRVLFEDEDENYISVPSQCPAKLKVIRDGQVWGEPIAVHQVFNKSMKTKDRFQFTEALDVHQGAGETRYKTILGELEPYDVYDQKYLQAYSLIDDEVIPTQVIIPVYLPIEVDVAVGLEGASKADFQNFFKNLDKLVKTFDSTPVKFEEDILCFAEKPTEDYDYIEPLETFRKSATSTGSSESPASKTIPPLKKSKSVPEPGKAPPPVPQRTKSISGASPRQQPSFRNIKSSPTTVKGGTLQSSRRAPPPLPKTEEVDSIPRQHSTPAPQSTSSQAPKRQKEEDQNAKTQECVSHMIPDLEGRTTPQWRRIKSIMLNELLDMVALRPEEMSSVFNKALMVAYKSAASPDIYEDMSSMSLPDIKRKISTGSPRVALGKDSSPDPGATCNKLQARVQPMVKSPEPVPKSVSHPVTTTQSSATQPAANAKPTAAASAQPGLIQDRGGGGGRGSVDSYSSDEDSDSYEDCDFLPPSPLPSTQRTPESKSPVTKTAGPVRHTPSTDSPKSPSRPPEPSSPHNIAPEPAQSTEPTASPRTLTKTSSWSTLQDLPEDISDLSVSDVAACLEMLNLGKYTDDVASACVDGRLLQTLDVSMLMEEFNMTKFEALKLCKFATQGWRPKV